MVCYPARFVVGGAAGDGHLNDKLLNAARLGGGMRTEKDTPPDQGQTACLKVCVILALGLIWAIARLIYE